MTNWFKKYLVLILVVLFSFSTLGARYLVGGQTFGERYPGVSPDGLVVWLDQADVRSYGDSQTWNDISGLRNNVDQTTGANQADLYATYRDFNGTTDFIQQVEEDAEQGALTFIADGGTAEFRDAGQDFRDWETDPAVIANAQYRIVIHTDNGVSYAYLGAANTGTGAGSDSDCYSDYALTTRGWKGRTTPQASPDTPATYEIYKVLGDDNLTGAMTILVGIKPDDGHPGVTGYIIGAHDAGRDVAKTSIALEAATGKILAHATDTGDPTRWIQSTDDAVFTDGAQAAFKLISVSFELSAGIVIGVNGSTVASTLITGAVRASLYDTYLPYCIGAIEYNEVTSGYYNGLISQILIFNRILTAAEIQQIYLTDYSRFAVAWWRLVLPMVLVFTLFLMATVLVTRRNRGVF